MFAFKGVKFYIYHGREAVGDSSTGLLMLKPGLLHTRFTGQKLRSRGWFECIPFKIMRKLFCQKLPATPAFEITFSSQGVVLLQIRFIIDQFPRSPVGSCEISFGPMRAKSRPQIGGKTDVEPVIGFGSKNVNVEHIRSLVALARERSSVERGKLYVPTYAIE